MTAVSRTSNRRGVLVAAISLVLGVSGCGGAHRTAADPPSSTLSAHKQLEAGLLRLDQLPAGSRSEPSQNLNSYGSSLTESLKSTQYSPAVCKAPREEQAKVDSNMDRVGVVAAVPPLPLRYTNVITRGGESIPLVRQMFLGQCAQVQMDRFSNGNPYDTTTLTSKEVASESIPGADDTVVIEQNSTVVSKLPAADETLPHFTSAKLFGYARMPDGVMVVLQQTADQESQLDQSQFFALFHRTVLNYLGKP